MSDQSKPSQNKILRVLRRKTREEKKLTRKRAKSLEPNRLNRSFFFLLTLGRLKKWERKFAKLQTQYNALPKVTQDEVDALRSRVDALQTAEIDLNARLAIQDQELQHLEHARARADASVDQTAGASDALTISAARNKNLTRGASEFLRYFEQRIFQTDGLSDAGNATLRAIEAGLPGEDIWQTLMVMSQERHGTPGFRSIVPYIAPRRDMPKQIVDALHVARKSLQIIDIGSEVLAWEDDVYAPLARTFPCKVVGFDPFSDGEREAERSDGRVVKTLPFLIGDGRDKVFHSNRSSATSSLLPTGTVTKAMPLLHLSLETQKTHSLPSYKLDDLYGTSVPGGTIDFLKIDVQGSADEVLEYSERTLKQTLTVHVEVEFCEVYDQQKLFSDVDRRLRDSGFAMIDFLDLGRMNHGALSRDPERFAMYGRALWADVVYLAGYDGGRTLTPEQILSQALTMHEVYNKQDVVAELLKRYDAMTDANLLMEYNR